MSRKALPKIHINKEEMRDKIYNAGYSLRGLIKELPVSYTLFMKYWKMEAFPDYILNEIEDIIEPKTKKVWARIGMTISVTEDELLALMKESDSIYGGYDDVLIPEDQARKWLRNAVVDGDCYIPAPIMEEFRDWYKDKLEKEASPA